MISLMNIPMSFMSGPSGILGETSLTHPTGSAGAIGDSFKMDGGSGKMPISCAYGDIPSPRLHDSTRGKAHTKKTFEEAFGFSMSDVHGVFTGKCEREVAATITRHATSNVDFATFFKKMEKFHQYSERRDVLGEFLKQSTPEHIKAFIRAPQHGVIEFCHDAAVKIIWSVNRLIDKALVHKIVQEFDSFFEKNKTISAEDLEVITAEQFAKFFE